MLSFFIHPDAYIGVLYRLFEFLDHPSITSISKKIVLVKSLGNLPVKHSFWMALFKYFYRPSWCEKDYLPWKVHVHFRYAKESCLLSCLQKTGVWNSKEGWKKYQRLIVREIGIVGVLAKTESFNNQEREVAVKLPFSFLFRLRVRNFRQVNRCAHASTCLTWRSLN